jgi:hypothetical protein
MPRVRCRDLHHILRRALRNDLAAFHAAFWTQVDDPIRRLNDVEIMFDDYHAVALFHQAVEDFEEFADILKMQAGGGLV